jgi:hypothetical protein
MASQYGIITIAGLQKRTCRTYSSYIDQNSVRNYSDDNIEDWISQAERMICMYLGQTYDSNAPQAVVYCVKEIAKIFADNQLIEDGVIQNRQVIEPVLTPALTFMLDKLTVKQQAEGRIKGCYGVEDR